MTRKEDEERIPSSERGKRAGFDRKTGAATGSGSGAGDPDETREDYDSDLHGNMPAEQEKADRRG